MIRRKSVANSRTNPIWWTNPIGFVLLVCLSPLAHAQSTDSTHIYLKIEGCHFFVDNEYFGHRIEGYTLPGFRLTPKLSWQLSQRFRLEGGVSWLHYWGAHRYPATLTYNVLPSYSDTSTLAHILPWMQAQIKLKSNLSLTLGSLDASRHLLPLPLYNTERLYAADPEQGVQVNYTSHWIEGDVWVDWREFIWNDSPRQERLTVGASALVHSPTTRWRMLLPIHFIAQHIGGQILNYSSHIQNHFNASLGLGIEIENATWSSAASCRLMGYHQYGSNEVSFDKGWAFYPEVKFSWKKRLLIDMSYWYSNQFIPLLGSALYSNLSTAEPNLVFNHTEVVTLHAAYLWNPQNEHFSLRFEGAAYHYPSEHQTQLSLGCIIGFSPTIRLR